MNAFVDFIVRLLGDALQMPVLLGEVALREPLATIIVAVGTVFIAAAVGVFGEVALREPLATIIVAVGTVFIAAAVGVFGYALAGALGIPLPNLGSGPNKRIE